MDGLTFIDQMVGHLLWPLEILLVVLLFRGPLQDKFRNITQVKAGPGGVEAQFGQVLEQSE